MHTSHGHQFVLVLLALVLVTQISSSQTVTSTSTGGRWNAAATWVGGVIPTSSSDVIIAGTVLYANGDGSCRNLTINAGASLYNETGYAWPEQILTVNGNLTNNGTIRSQSSLFVVKVFGNITNNGTWTVRRTELAGVTTQTLAQASGKVFESPFKVLGSGGLIAGADLRFSSSFDLNKVTLNMSSFAITLVGSSAGVSNGSVSNAKDIVGVPASGNYPVLDNITYDGSPNIKGRIQINTLVTLRGSVTVIDTLENSSGYGHPEKKLQITGNLINNGIIRNWFSNGIALAVTGNITNNGTWAHNRTELSGNADQSLVLATGKQFNASFSVTDSTLGNIVAGSDLVFTGGFNLGKTTLDMKNYSITLIGEGTNISNGTVTNTTDLIGLPAGGTSYPYLDNITYSGNPNIKGRLKIHTLVVMKGNVTLTDTLENLSGYGHPEKILKIVGNISNNGIIRNYFSNGLALNVTGNVTNNGKWVHNRTELSGSANQILTLGAGKLFEAHFSVTDSLGFIVAGSDLVFTGQFNLNKCVFDAKSYAVTLKGEGANIYGGTVINARDLIGRIVNDYPVVDNITYDGKINLRGILKFNSGTLRGDVTVTDTIQNSSGYAHPEKIVRVIGSLTNNGVVRNGGSNGLAMDVTGNVTANKAFTNNRIQMSGSGNRTVVDKVSQVTYLSTGEKVVLYGENYVPALSIDSKSKCLLANGSNIYAANGTIDETLDNWSGITTTRKFTGAQDYSFFKARIKVLPNAAIDSVRIQSYGHQVPATFAGAVKSYWRVRTFASNPKQSFSSMTFLYNDDLLGSNTEAAVQVYMSQDSGITWKQVSTTSNTTRDLNANTITLADAFGVGDYLLSSSADPSSVRPSIIVSILGRNQIRVGGAPNRYTINYVNNSDSPTLDFLLPVMTERFVHIKSAELPLFDGTKVIVPIDSIMYDGDDSSAVFYVAAMNPRESRSFDVIVTSDAPPINKLSGLGKGSEILIEPLTTYAAAVITYTVTKYGSKIVSKGIEYVGDKVNEQLKPTPQDLEKFKQIYPNTWQELLEQNKKENVQIEPLKKTGEKLSKILITKAMNITGGAYDIAASTVKAVKGIVPNLRAKLWVWIMDDVGYFGVNETTTEEVSSRSQKKANPVRSMDPNEKIGPTGFGPKNYITSAGKMSYRILFENKKEATAPAWKVTIVDTLRAELDPATFEFGPTSHDSAQYNWKKTLAGNIARWEIEGIELPPNVTPPQGEGWVAFTVNAKPNLASGTTIKNSATIVFDMNNPIATNEYINTLDYSAPRSTMKSIPTRMTASKLIVRWSGVDDQNGSGVESYTLYAAKDSGAFAPIGSTTADSMVVNVDTYTHRYSFYALAKDNVGNVETTRPAPVTSDITNGVGGSGESIPAEFALYQNYPNPFNPTTTIAYTLAAKVRASLKIYDVLGREIVSLLDEEQLPGKHFVKWDAGKVSSGVYFYRLAADDFVQTHKLVILK